MKNKVKLNIYSEICQYIFKNHKKQIKALYIWTKIHSIPIEKRYREGNINEPVISLRRLVKERGFYGYQIFKEVKKSSLFFHNVKGEEDLLRAKSIKNVIISLNLNIKKALKYSEVECDYGYIGFKNGFTKLFSRACSTKKELAKKLNITPQTVSKVFKRFKYKAMKIKDKTWTMLKELTFSQYEDSYMNRLHPGYILTMEMIKLLSMNGITISTA